MMILPCLRTVSTAGLSSSPDPDDVLALDGTSGNKSLCLEEKLVSIKDEGWSKARRLSLPLSLSIKNVEISGSCKGILCISDQKCYRVIFLLNPSIRVFKLLPFSGFIIATVENSFPLLGFGYLQEEDDYKDSGGIPLFHLNYKAAIWLGNDFLIQKATSMIGRTGREFTWRQVYMLDELISAFYLSKVDEAYIWSMKDLWELRFVIKLPQRVEGYSYIFLKPLTILKNGEILMEAGEKARILHDTLQ
ncbi:hypothetical protein POTOM_052238 [Populus tomentosa]|uniref:Uncharacterized protein n=1 Tax=Populus tomentosa TaxID=118781 RepID=A0A8X8C5M4_POPTO|nr:hypothetical protein POTOM_052238 [Populus tomentosa]